MNLLKTIKGAANDFIKHWDVPAEGNYVPNKETIALSGGGVGVKTVNCMNSFIQMTASCLLMGSVYKLSPSQLMVLFLIANVISIIKTPFVSWLVDNTHTKMGKFRPYLIIAGIPCLLGVFGLVFAVPVDGSAVTKMVLIAVFYNIYLIGQQLYNNAFIGLTQVISPNSGERSKIMSISEFISNLGPSLVQIILPFFAEIFFGKEGLLDIRSYRILLPIFCVLGYGLGIVVALFTKERVIMPRVEKIKIRFKDGLRLVGKNVDFWIVTVSKFFGGFKGSISLLLTWICLYQIGSSAMNGVLSMITAMAFIPGMLLAPLLLKKLGHGKATAASYATNILMGLIMLFTFRFGAIFFAIALFLYNFASGPQYIMQTTITADALDEIQLKHGERVEGFAQNFQMMFEVAGNILAQFVFMLIYENNGLAPGADGNTDYNILKDAAVREPIITLMVIVAIIASVLSAIPFLFCKMNYKKHAEIITALELLKKKADGEDEDGVDQLTTVPDALVDMNGDILRNEPTEFFEDGGGEGDDTEK